MFRLFLTLVPILFFSQEVSAGDFSWSGLYRFEIQQISNQALDGDREKIYGLHHLVLKPKIVAADGLIIQGRFDIFNNDNYPTSTMGAFLGNSTGVLSSETQETDRANVDSLNVTQVYLTYVQEFGALLVGRAPTHFGLGMTHNAGEGMFDHWQDTRDMVGYKIVMGNIFLMPMYGKVNENNIESAQDDVSDFLVHFQYEDPEDGIEMGIFYQQRTASELGNTTANSSSNDITAIAGAGASVEGAYSVDSINVFASSETETFRFALEGAFVNGKLGLVDTNGDEVKTNALGISTELEYRPEGSSWIFGANSGYATGDDPETTDSYEGFIFDRNYDVAMLLFNFSMGQEDFLRTGLINSRANASGTTNNDADIEAISNVIYVAPYVKYKWTDEFSLGLNFVYASLNQNPLANVDVATDIGYEIDFSLEYRPNERVTWINEFGAFMPGSTFEGGDTNNYATGTVYGFRTRAAISF